MSYECPYCGAEVGDPGDGFIEHVRESEACRVPWEHEMDTNADEWSKR